MGRYRRVVPRIWADDKFPYLGDTERLLFLYHLTSERATPFLLYVEGEGSMADALRWPARKLQATKTRLAATGMVTYAADGSQLVFLPNALRLPENAPESVNAVKTWLGLFAALPRSLFRAEAAVHLRGLRSNITHAMTRAFLDGLPEADGTASVMPSGMPSPMPSGGLVLQEQEQEREQEQEQEHTPATRRSLRSRESLDHQEAFETFWTSYPRRVGKQAAWRAWRKLPRDAPALAVLVAAVAAQRTWPEWQRDGGRYIPHPATWLTQGRWADEPTSVVPGRHPRTERNVAGVETWLEAKRAQLTGEGTAEGTAKEGTDDAV
jgi:hypothetical protein